MDKGWSEVLCFVSCIFLNDEEKSGVVAEVHTVLSIFRF